MATTTYSTAQAIFWGEFVEVAYEMYRDNPTNPIPPQPADFPAGWTLITYLTIDPVDPIFPDEEFIGFVVQSIADPTQYGVVFRGTESDLDWIGDLELWLVPFDDVLNGGSTEAGFTEMYNSVKSTPALGGAPTPFNTLGNMFTGATNITVAGHSLGGALAIMYSLVFAFKNDGVPLQCYTFAAPMVGDQQFASTFEFYVKENYRVYNFPDIVPRIPGTELGYVQLPNGIEIDSLTNTNIHWNIGCFHSLIVYLTVLGAEGYSLGSCAVNAATAAQAVLPNAARRVATS